MNRKPITHLLATSAVVGIAFLGACRSDDRMDDERERTDRSYNRATYDRTGANDRRTADHVDNYGNGDKHYNTADNQATMSHSAPSNFNRVTGNLTTSVDAGVDRVWQASQDAMNDLHFVTDEKKMDGNKSWLSAKTANNDSIRVTLNRRSDRVTDITVGVGTMGKESTAHLILENILDRINK